MRKISILTVFLFSKMTQYFYSIFSAFIGLCNVWTIMFSWMSFIACMNIMYIYLYRPKLNWKFQCTSNRSKKGKKNYTKAIIALIMVGIFLFVFFILLTGLQLSLKRSYFFLCAQIYTARFFFFFLLLLHFL